MIVVLAPLFISLRGVVVLMLRLLVTLLLVIMMREEAGSTSEVVLVTAVELIVGEGDARMHLGAEPLQVLFAWQIW